VVGAYWRPPPAPDVPGARRVEIAVIWSPIHTDIVLPVKGVSVDWANAFDGELAPDGLTAADYVAIGWGSESFYRDVPTMADITPGIIARSLFFDRTAMHVTPLADPAIIPKESRVILSIPEDRLRLLETFVLASFDRDTAGAAQRIPGQSYGYGDAFYFAHGRYWPLRTCNQWTGEGLRIAGISVGYWTPFSQSISWPLSGAETVTSGAAR